jgi:hypothetical protein
MPGTASPAQFVPEEIWLGEWSPLLPDTKHLAGMLWIAENPDQRTTASQILEKELPLWESAWLNTSGYGIKALYTSKTIVS